MTTHTAKDEFDHVFEETVEQLDEIARATLENEDIQAALADPNHDDCW